MAKPQILPEYLFDKNEVLLAKRLSKLQQMERVKYMAELFGRNGEKIHAALVRVYPEMLCNKRTDSQGG